MAFGRQYVRTQVRDMDDYQFGQRLKRTLINATASWGFSLIVGLVIYFIILPRRIQEGSGEFDFVLLYVLSWVLGSLFALTSLYIIVKRIDRRAFYIGMIGAQLFGTTILFLMLLYGIITLISSVSLILLEREATHHNKMDWGNSNRILLIYALEISIVAVMLVSYYLTQ